MHHNYEYESSVYKVLQFIGNISSSSAYAAQEQEVQSCGFMPHNCIDFGCLCRAPCNHDRWVTQYVSSSQQAEIRKKIEKSSHGVKFHNSKKIIGTHFHSCRIRAHPTHLNRERKLLVKFTDEQIVAERLSHLHDSHHRSVDLILSVLEHALFGCFLFFVLFAEKLHHELIK